MADWNSDLYLRFADERTRPAKDLLDRVPAGRINRAVDLGCGPGNSTELIAARFPDATITGLDTSDAMLAAARQRLPKAEFVKGDVAAFRADPPADLLFANAVLQWVPDHERLFPALMASLAPAGVLAVQMPDNLEEPSHRLMREVAADGPWAMTLAHAAAIRTPIFSAERYYDLLTPLARHVDIWRTTYVHALTGAAAIVEWVRATGLRPFLDPLDAAEQAGFLAAYESRIANAYPRRIDGRVLLPFPRLFIVAQAP